MCAAWLSRRRAHGSCRSVVETAGLLANAGLFAELHYGLEAVGEGVQQVGVGGIQPCTLLWGVEAVIPYEAADEGPVLLLHMAAVVAVEWP